MSTVKSRDGTVIQAEYHRPENEPTKGLVVVCHGFGEHRGAYLRLAARLAESGYASALFDQRGHGDLPEKRLGLLESYERFLDDAEAVKEDARLAFPGVPLVLYGHSMGGNIAANYLLRRGSSQFAAAVLESPWLGLYHDEPVLAPVVSALSYLVPDMPLPKAKTRLAPEEITGDPDMQAENARDALYHNRMSARLFREIRRGCRFAISNAPRLATPLFLAVAANDHVVSNDAIDRFCQRCADRVERRDYDSRHAIHSDSAREAYFDDMILFLDERCRTDRL